MHRGFSSALSVATVLWCGLLTGCLGGGYSGDGKMIDNGPLAATDRYVLDLGPIDLTKQERRSFRLSNLPSENFATGIELREATNSHVPWDKKEIDASVSMDIIDEGGKTLMHAAGSLRQWTWEMRVTGATGAFLYVDGVPGSFFTPAKGRSYRLDVSVVEPDRMRTNVKAIVKLKTGGWK